MRGRKSLDQCAKGGALRDLAGQVYVLASTHGSQPFVLRRLEAFSRCIAEPRALGYLVSEVVSGAMLDSANRSVLVVLDHLGNPTHSLHRLASGLGFQLFPGCGMVQGWS